MALTAGAIEMIHDGTPGLTPTLQLLQISRAPALTGHERAANYDLILSDGVHFMRAEVYMAPCSLATIIRLPSWT